MINKKFFVTLLVVVSLLVMLAAQAKIKTYTGVGEDYPNQFETPEDAKARALRSAIEDAKKQAGVGLKIYSRSIDNELVDDEVSTITSNSYKVVGEVEYKRLPPIKLPGSRGLIVVGWQATVDVDVDDAEVTADWIKRPAAEKEALIKRNRAAEESFNADIRRADELSKRAANVSTEQEEFDLKHEVEALNNDFQVNGKIEEGNRLNYENKPDEALEQYGEALKIKFVDAVGEFRMLKAIDNLEISKMRSRHEAERNAVKEAVIYLKDYARKINVELTDDELFTIANNIYVIVDEEQQIVPTEDDSVLLIRTNARYKFLVDEIMLWLQRDKKERVKIVKDDQSLQKVFDDNGKEYEQLRKQYESQRR